MDDIFGEVISSYSRSQAIDDGVLIDVTTTAKEANFKIPVAMTSAAWVDCVEWPEDLNDSRGTCQDQNGRLWDVLWMAFLAARSASPGTSSIPYKISRVPRDGVSTQSEDVSLVLRIGGGDSGEPVMTIMQPGES